MVVDEIQNGIVIDHIRAGLGMELFKMLDLENTESPVALFKNATSSKMGKKDIIKIDGDYDVNTDVLGYIDPECTVNIILNGKLVNKFHPELPERMENIVVCKNPRCITTQEPSLKQVFKLTDKASRTYRCIYCETKLKDIGSR